jgi:hypothetical protein
MKRRPASGESAPPLTSRSAQIGAGADPLADVVSWNLKRRHLSTSQKATLAVALKPMFEEQARDRQSKAGGDHKTLMANLPQADKGTARDQAAAAV